MLFEQGVPIWRQDPEHVTKEDRHCHKIVLLFLGPLSLWHHYYSSSSASKGKQKSSVSHCWASIARQRSEFASQTSIWPCLTASNHEICHVHHHARTLSPPNLSHMDFLDGPAAIQWSRLIISCTTQDASPKELVNPKILEMNRYKNIHKFGLILPAIVPACVISSCVCIVLLFEQVLRAM